MKKRQYLSPEQREIKMNARFAICDVSDPSATGDDPIQGGDD